MREYTYSPNTCDQPRLIQSHRLQLNSGCRQLVALDKSTYDDAIAMFGYDTIQSDFVPNLVGVGALLTQIQHSEHTLDAADTIHKVLGLCGILGARHLFDVLVTMENKLRANHADVADYSVICQATLTATLKHINELRGSV